MCFGHTFILWVSNSLVASYPLYATLAKNVIIPFAPEHTILMVLHDGVFIDEVVMIYTTFN